MISGFRFGFLGQSDIGNTNQAVIGAALGLGVLNLVLGYVTYRVLEERLEAQELDRRPRRVLLAARAAGLRPSWTFGTSPSTK